MSSIYALRAANRVRREHVFVTEKHSFEYNAKDSELTSVVVKGPQGTLQKVHLDAASKRGWFEATAPGQYTINVTFSKTVCWAQQEAWPSL